MSSLWTPGGEVPIERDQPRQQPDPGTPDPGTADDAELAAEYERMQAQILDLPAGDVVAQHAMGFYELAALHLSQPEPRLADARLAIDALTALLEALEGRLGEAEGPLAAALPQLKMAFVEVSDRARGAEGS